MHFTSPQKEKINELFNAIEILFNNTEFGLMYSEIEEAWIIGDYLRDLLLFRNPPITEYMFYIQVKNPTDIYPWLSRLAEKQIKFETLKNTYAFNKQDVYQTIALSLTKFDIDYEIIIFVGSLSPENFITENLPISISLLGLDISELFVSLGEKESVEEISKKIWYHPSCKKDIKNKSIIVLKQKWMTDIDNYEYLELYLERTHQKLNQLGFV